MPSQNALEKELSNHEVIIPKDDDEVFSFQHQLPPLDLSIYDSMSIDQQDNLDDHTYLMDIMPKNLISSSMNILPDPISYEDGFMIGRNDELGFQDQEMLMMMFPDQETYMNSLGFPNQETCMMNSSGFPSQRATESKDTNKEEMQLVIYGYQEPRKEAENKVVRRRLNRHSSRMVLSREVVSQYFYLPINKAAKELNVGLTLLKKRCRELGFGRWPHRKLKSLQKLITNVQELKTSSTTGNGAEEVLQLLEKEKKNVEEVPDLQLKAATKRLRQSCFKANYKKRKTMGSFTNSSTLKSPSCSSSTCVNSGSSEGMEDGYCADEE